MIVHWLHTHLPRLLAWSPVEVILLGVGLVITLRHIITLCAAEQGRKRDLVRKTHPVRKPVVVLTACLRLTDLPGLQHLLSSLLLQEYPTGSRRSPLRMQVVCTSAVSDALVSVLQATGLPQGMIKSFVYPESECPGVGRAITWLIERSLAGSGDAVFVFLHPYDVVKPDFITHVASRTLEHPVIQGQRLDRYPPKTPMSGVDSLETRLTARVSNAGRYHMGWSGWLQSSGWAARQEVLEMVPFYQGEHQQPLEYTLRLWTHGFRVAWVPGVQTFSQGMPSRLSSHGQYWLNVWDQTGLVLKYGPALLMQTFRHRTLQYADGWLSLLKPPVLLTGFALAAAILLAHNGHLPGTTAKLYIMLLSLLVLGQWLGLLVARCRPQDFITMLLLTLPCGLWGTLLSPLAALNGLWQLSHRPRGQAHQSRYRQIARNRFQDELYVPLRPILTPTSTHLADTELSDEAAYSAGQTVQRRSSTDADDEIVLDTPQERRITRNGGKQLPCLVTTHETEEGRYRLTLEYRGAAFTTQGYAEVEDAYAELSAKLARHGLQLR